MSSRRNWDSPTPSLASECAPPPVTKGGRAHSPAGEGLGESQFHQFRRLEKKLGTLQSAYSVVDTRENENFTASRNPADWRFKTGPAARLCMIHAALNSENFYFFFPPDRIPY